MYLKGVPWRFLMRWKEVSADLISAESRCGEGWFEFIHEAIWRCYSPNFNTKWWPRPLSPHRQKFFHEAPCQLIASHPQDHWNFSHLILLVNKDQATVCVHVFLFENCEVSKDSVSARKIKCYVCACVLNIVHIWDNSCSRGLSDFFIFYFFPPFSSPWWHTHTHMALAPAITGAAAPPLSLSHDKTSFILIHSVDLVLQTNKHLKKVCVACFTNTLITSLWFVTLEPSQIFNWVCIFFF